MADAPPPYSETDVYSNAGRPHSNVGSNTGLLNTSSHTPRASGAFPPSSVDSASIASSVIYTPPYTPAEEQDLDFVSPSQWYFDSRPVQYRAVGATFNHEIQVGPQTRFEDLSSRYDVSFADRDISTQDWATFINFLLPQHVDQNNQHVADRKMRAELLDERMQNLTTDEKSEGRERDMTNLDAQLGQLAPRHNHSEEVINIPSVVREWNSGFFEPRGARIIANVERGEEYDDPPIVTPDEISEFQRRASFASAQSAQSARSAEAAGAGPSSTRPTFGSTPAASGGDANTGRQQRRPRNWGWSDHGPGQHRTPPCVSGRGRNRNGGYRMGISDHEQESMPQARRARTEGEFHVPQGEHFKLGPIVADESGFRMGTLFRATSEGVNIGPMFVGKKPPVEVGDEESDGASTVSAESEGSLPDIDDVTPRQLPVLRQSLMDWLNHPEQPVSKVQMDQLKANLKLTQADKTTVKPEGEEVKALKTELKELKKQFKEAKRNRKLRTKEARRERRQKRRADRRERRQARIEEKLAQRREAKGKGKATHCSRQAEREAREAAKIQARQAREQAQLQAQQAREAPKAYSQQARENAQLYGQQARDSAQREEQLARQNAHMEGQRAREAAQSARQNIQQNVRQQVNGFLGFVTPPVGGRSPPGSQARGSVWAMRSGLGMGGSSSSLPQPTQPPAAPMSAPPVPRAPPMPMMPPMPTMPRQPSMPSMPRHNSATSSHSSISQNKDLQENLSYLRSEAARQMSEAETLRASAEHMRKETQNTAFDEKTRVKLSHDAADLEEEANRLAEEADRQLAEALQLEQDEEDKMRGEAENSREVGRGYLRRMRENGGVVV